MKLINKASGCLCAIALGLLLASGAAQAGNKQAKTANKYVDSMYSWGSWALGVEPAAGGPRPPANNAVNNRAANIHFRPNDNTVYSLSKRKTATVALNPTPAPTHVAPTTVPGTAPSGSPGSFFSK